MVIDQGLRPQALEMLFVQHDDMVEELPTHTPDQPLDIRGLPWRPRPNHDCFDPQMLDALPKARAVEAVAVTAVGQRQARPATRPTDEQARPRTGGLSAGCAAGARTADRLPPEGGGPEFPAASSDGSGATCERCKESRNNRAHNRGPHRYGVSGEGKARRSRMRMR